MNAGNLVMETDHRNGLKDRRSGSDRRSWQNSFDFPFVDSHGILVTEERRVHNDRRIQLNSAETSPQQ